MQIGSATFPLSAPALSPAPARSSADTPAAPDTESSPDATVTLSADGKRLSSADQNAAAEAEQNPQQAQLDRQAIAELASRDADVRSHEQAHASVGGAYAGSPSFTLQRGPDGKSYAVGGEVGIDVSAVANDPAATISKMEVVMRAALAPADPSAQDLRVAAQAQGLAAAARAELAQNLRSEAVEAAEKKRLEKAEEDPSVSDTAPVSDSSASLQVYQSVASPADTPPQLDAFA